MRLRPSAWRSASFVASQQSSFAWADAWARTARRSHPLQKSRFGAQVPSCRQLPPLWHTDMSVAGSKFTSIQFWHSVALQSGAMLLGRGAAGGDGGVTPTTHSGSQLVSMAGVVHITIHSLQPGYVPLPGMHWKYLQIFVPATSHQLLHHSAL